MRIKSTNIQLIIYFSIIFIFTFLPFVGLIIDSYVWDKYDIRGMALANACFIFILYSGIFIAFKKIKMSGFEWSENYKLYNANKYQKKILRCMIIFAIIQFMLRGYAIFSGANRGDVRTSMGI